jgi:hypothetical protein
MGGDVHVLDGPAFAQILNAQAGEDFAQQRRRFGMAPLLDLRPHERRVEHRVRPLASSREGTLFGR